MARSQPVRRALPDSSRPSEGSSNNTTLESSLKAAGASPQRTARRRRWPPESWETRSARRCSNPHSESTCETAFRSGLRPDALSEIRSLSSTVSSPHIPSFCNVRPIGGGSFLRPSESRTTLSSSASVRQMTLPEVSGSMPAHVSRSVVLPEPLAPARATTSPCPMWKSMSFRTTRGPRCTSMPATCIIVPCSTRFRRWVIV